MDKKYELLKNDCVFHGTTVLYRIKALKDFADVKEGDLGGYIESEDNLSQKDNCWVYGEHCKVMELAYICDNARVYDHTTIGEHAIIGDNTIVKDWAKVMGNTLICGDATIKGVSLIAGNVTLRGNNTVIGNTVRLTDTVTLTNAQIQSYQDYLCFTGIKQSFYSIAFYRSDRGIMVYCDGNTWTLFRFYKSVLLENKPNMKEYLLMCDMVESHFGLNDITKEK